MNELAIEVSCEGQDLAELPAPCSLGTIGRRCGLSAGAVDVGTSRSTDALETRPVRLNISLPSSLVRRIEDYAKDRHMTCSGFLVDTAWRAMDNG
jgi:hypothetical protein